MAHREEVEREMGRGLYIAYIITPKLTPRSRLSTSLEAVNLLLHEPFYLTAKIITISFHNSRLFKAIKIIPYCLFIENALRLNS